MTRLTDLQSILLTHAASHADSSLPAPPDSVAGDPARVMSAITQLLRRGLLEERRVTAASALAREEGDLRYGAFITAAGLDAIGVEPAVAALDSAPAATPKSAPRATKAALVLGLLRREQGATMAELVEATGWLPHTTRAGLTGLRKKGHALSKFKRDEVTCYRIESI